MSGEALYERYKDALRRGHVASLRGRLEEALTAYAEAAAIAPERATPHASAGAALMRRKRPADALRSYTAAVRLAPKDEAALMGRAQALAALDRRPEAADAYDAVAEVLAANGKLSDAVDAARRGLELAEGRERRRTLQRLIERLRESDPGDKGRQSLERALVTLDGPAVEPVAKVQPASPVAAPAAEVAPVAQPVEARGMAEPEPALEAGPAEEAAAGVAAPIGAREAAPEPTVVAAPEPELFPEAVPERVAEAEPVAAEPEPELEPAPAAVVEEPAFPPHRPVLDRDLPANLDLASLALTVDAAIDARSNGTSLDRVLDLASAYRRVGRDDAALDICYLALAVAPDAVDLHLALVELYDGRGWTTLADEKLDLLDRLASFDGAGDDRIRVGSARAARR